MHYLAVQPALLFYMYTYILYTYMREKLTVLGMGMSSMHWRVEVL